MIRIENEEVFGWEASIRGMRNPMNSHNKSDSHYTKDSDGWTNEYIVGENDLKLMKQLRKAGSDHAKYLRMINVTADITAPRYWWEQFSTYRIGVVQNSTSTMHRIQTTPITTELFSFDHVKLCDIGKAYLDELEKLRVKFNNTKDKKYWYALIQLLPQSYNQKRTIQLNYAVLLNIYHARKNHKLDEWHTFCDWIEELPYFKEICLED